MARFTRGFLRRFRDEADGSATIEAVLWVPLFAMLVIMISDASFVFFGRAQAMRLLQDGNRAFSVGRIEDADATADFILDSLSRLSPNASVTSTLDQGVVTSVATIPVNDLVAFGTIDHLSDFTMTISSQHYMEY